MKKPLLTLPCSQRPEDLHNGSGAYHCQLCSKHITDFRGKTTDEIVRTVQENPGRVCGIFSPSQFVYKTSRVSLPRLTQPIGLSLLGILGFMGPVLTGCEAEPDDQTAVKLDAFRKLKFPMSLHGILRDEQTGVAIPNAVVRLLQRGNSILETETDEQGEFAFFIRREDLHRETFDLVFAANGYTPDTLRTLQLTGTANKKVSLTLQATPASCTKTVWIDNIPIPGDVMVEGIAIPNDPPEPPLAGVPVMGKPVLENTPEPVPAEQKLLNNPEKRRKKRGKNN